MPAGEHTVTRAARRTVLRRGAGLALGAAAAATLPGCAADTGSGTTADGRTVVELWHGQTDTGRVAIEKLVTEFNRTHPGIHVDSGGGVLADSMLQKLTAALASGSFPDIAYVFGSDLANVAHSPSVVDLTDTFRSGPLPWNNYWAAGP